MYYPLAYHITFGTYGTRLHGDSRGTVDRSHNVYGEPIVGRAEDWHREELTHLKLTHLKFPPRVFTREQMVEAERLIPEI